MKIYIKLIMLCLFILLFIVFGRKSHGNKSDKNPNKQQDNASVIHFLYSGELLGELEPCGCSGPKLGGIVQRISYINHHRGKWKNLFLIDGGLAPGSWDMQNIIKSNFHLQMLDAAGYDYCFDTGKTAKKYKTILLGSSQKYHVRKLKNGIKVLFYTVNGTLSKKIDKNILEREKPDIVFILAKKLWGDYDSLLAAGPYTTIVFLSDSQEPYSPITRKNLIITSAGNRGRYLGLLQLTLNKKRVVGWQNETIRLTQEYTPDDKTLHLLENYKKEIKNKRLLDMQIKEISAVGFVGSETCLSCHQYEYQQWQSKKHAHAFETLVKENYHYDPECVSCHVVGFKYEEGFRNQEETPHLIDVGCEACHGAGAKHAIESDDNYGKTNGADTCVTCHQRDRTPDFEYKKFLKKIKHWRE